MGSDSNVWHQVHAQREDGVAAMFLIRDVEPRADQPKIFVVELPYAVTDLSGQPDAAAYRRLSAFQEQWIEPACAALGWTFVAWKCEDGSFFLYLYGAGDPDALLEKLAPFDGELGFFNDVDADWSEYAALRELVEQAEAEDGEDGHDHGHDHHDHHDHEGHDHHDHEGHDHHDHDHHDHEGHDHHDHEGHDHEGHEPGRAALELPVDLTGEPAALERAAEDGPAPHGANGKSRSISAGSEAAAATHRPLPRTVPARTGGAKRAGKQAGKQAGSTARPGKRPAAAARPPRGAAAQRPAARPTPARSTQRTAAARPAKPAATKPAKRSAARPAKPATTKPAKRTAATRPAKRAASPSRRRPATGPRRSR